MTRQRSSPGFPVRLRGVPGPPAGSRAEREPAKVDASPTTSESHGDSLIPKEDNIELEGTVVEALGNSNFRVQINEQHSILARIAGKMRKFRIRVLPGDRVTVEVSPYDLTRGRITYRHRS